jgi:hypothetical protein
MKGARDSVIFGNSPLKGSILGGLNLVICNSVESDVFEELFEMEIGEEEDEANEPEAVLRDLFISSLTITEPDLLLTEAE